VSISWGYQYQHGRKSDAVDSALVTGLLNVSHCWVVF